MTPDQIVSVFQKIMNCKGVAKNPYAMYVIGCHASSRCQSCGMICETIDIVLTLETYKLKTNITICQSCLSLLNKTIAIRDDYIMRMSNMNEEKKESRNG